MDMSHDGLSHLFKGPGMIVEGFDRHQKYIHAVFIHFQLLLNTKGFLSVPHTLKCKGMGSTCLQTYTDMNFSPCFDVGT